MDDRFKAALRDVVAKPDDETRWGILTVIARSTEVFGSKSKMERSSEEAIAFIAEELRINEPAWWGGILKCAAAGLVLGGVAVLASPVWLPLAGFTAAGVAAGSIAAWLMTATTAAGSFFAACQSVGVLLSGSSYAMTFVAYLVGGGAVAGAGAGAGWDYFRRANADEQRQILARHMWQQAVDKSFPPAPVPAA